MQLDNIVVIARREYLERIKTKGFWIATVALPVFMAAVGILPALLLTRTGTKQRLVVVDAVGGLGSHVEEELDDGADATARIASFSVEVETVERDSEAQRLRLDGRVLADEIDDWVWVDAQGLENDSIEYHAESVSNFVTQSLLERSLSSVVRQYRLESAGYDVAEISGLVRGIDLVTVRVSEEGSREEEAASGIVLAYMLFFLLYIVLRRGFISEHVGPPSPVA